MQAGDRRRGCGRTLNPVPSPCLVLLSTVTHYYSTHRTLCLLLCVTALTIASCTAVRSIYGPKPHDTTQYPATGRRWWWFKLSASPSSGSKCTRQKAGISVLNFHNRVTQIPKMDDPFLIKIPDLIRTAPKRWNFMHDTVHPTANRNDGERYWRAVARLHDGDVGTWRRKWTHTTMKCYTTMKC